MPVPINTRPLAIALATCWLLATFCLTTGSAIAETPATGTASSRAEQPRLIVVVSVDQLCQDYLIRFQDNFSTNPQESFFTQVLQQGAWFPNCHHAHAFTYTAPGHAVQLTGAHPSIHGVIANDWFDRQSGKSRYCVSDPAVKVIGIASEKPMSPRVLLVDTVGDCLKLATQGKAKVMGVAIKDRASILMAGHRADAAYWLEKNQWVTSSYYRNDLPGYLRNLNEGNAIDQFRGKTWELLLPREKYHNQGPDDNEFENPPVGFSASFPHPLAKTGELTADQFGDQVLFSPYGNEFTLLAAREMIRFEELGADDIPDLLTINFSSNDYVGHAFGPMSLEVEDMTYRTDRQLAEFTQYLDQTVGVGRWTMALTADHGVAPIPELIAAHPRSGSEITGPKRNPLGDLKTVREQLTLLLQQELAIDPPAPGNAGPKLILELDPNQIYLNHDHPQLRGPALVNARRILRDWLIAQPYIATVVTHDELQTGGDSRLLRQIGLSFNPARSGDVLFVYTPYAIPGSSSANAKPRGTTHGSPWHYDTHVPLLFLGNGIAPGQYDRRVSPANLAPTLSRVLGINHPGGCVEDALHEALAPLARF